jgi:hypothetical protein
MAIGDVRSQDPNEQPQDQSPSDTTPPAQGLDQDEHEGEVEHHDQVKKRAMIRGGGMRMMGIRKKTTQEQNHHIQGCATIFKEITP